MTQPLITLDTAGRMIEVTVWPTADSAGLSVLVDAATWAQVAAQAEQLAPLRDYRMSEARHASSHHARRVP